MRMGRTEVAWTNAREICLDKHCKYRMLLSLALFPIALAALARASAWASALQESLVLRQEGLELEPEIETAGQIDSHQCKNGLAGGHIRRGFKHFFHEQ